MANQVQPLSYDQILGDMLSTYASKTGISSPAVGSASTSFFETVALAIARSSGDIFQTLLNSSIDFATGAALQAIAQEYGITPTQTSPATGFVNVIDSSFSKVSTTIYAGANPPNIGSTTIYVGSNIGFTPTGSVYLGRGTLNSEGPIAYSSIAPIGTYFAITLVTGTTKFHNIGESVILAQGGNRTVPVNTIVIAPSNGVTPDVQYSVTQQAVILDGETEVDNIPITALLPGSTGNAPIGAINEFASAPFNGATVTNANAISNGTDTETDDQLRTQIKSVLASTGLGTATAVKNSLIGATATDENATISSDSLVTNADGSATVFIDTGGGKPYEAKTAGIAIEHIIDSAIGGEKFFQLSTGGTQTSVAKAFLQSTNTAPFDLRGGDTLAVTVGGITYQHTFANSNFQSPGGATAYEVTASINANTTLGFEATTAGSGTYVVIRPISETSNSIKTATPITQGRDASIQLGFPSSEAQTLRLYKNNVPLSEDGNTASVFSQAQSLWSPSIITGDTLIVAVDGTAPITYVFTDADFIATGLYTSVASSNSLASWVQVMNAKMVGVTVSAVGNQLEITSNLGANNRAKVVIDPTSTLVTKNMFSANIGLTSTGKASDYTFDRNTAQGTLAVALAAGDSLSSGTTQTEATVQSNSIPGGTITFPAEGYMWVLIDNPGQIIPTGVTNNTFLAVSTPSSNIVRYTSTTANAFANVQVGDYVIVWSAELAAANRLEGRVNAVGATTLDIKVTAAEWAAVVPTAGVLFLDGFVVLRSTLAPQKFSTPTSIQTLDEVAAFLQEQSDSVTFGVVQEQFLTIKSNTLNDTGSILIVTSDLNGKLLNFVNGTSAVSQTSLIAFYDNQDSQAQMPLFVHAKVGVESVANPPDTFLNTFGSNIDFSNRDPNELVTFLQPYGTIGDEQPFGESVQETSLSGTTVNVASNPDVRRLRSNDRFFLSSPLDFGSNDSIVTVLDNNPVQETFQIPFARKALTNTSYTVNSHNFNAYDFDYGPTGNFASSFGSLFDFSNYKVLMQAKKVLKPTPSQTALLYRSVPWGRTGEKITVGYIYPSAANSPISSTVTIASTIAIYINLQSGNSIGSVGVSGPWAISVTPNTPSAGIDQVTYTWSGSGSSPLPMLSGGEYVNISASTGFNVNNTGVFRVSTQAGFTPTANSFSVQMPTGQAVIQSGLTILVNNSINFYQPIPTNAAQIASYVNASLTQYVTATIVNDGGMTGSGTIVLSTYEDSGFTYKNVSLLDGINWIASSNLSGSPQFVLKKALALPSDIGYAFNNGENIRIVPTTIDQVFKFASVLAVTGFTTAGAINTANRNSVLEFSTNTVGSNGYIQIIGGTANGYAFPVLGSGLNINNSLMSISANQVASAGVASDQWFRLQASVAQQKETLLAGNSSVTITPNSPSPGNSTITLLHGNLTQRYFGVPRAIAGLNGLNFRVEKQGNLVCLSWTGSDSSTHYLSFAVNFNAGGGGTLSVNPVLGTNDTQYVILTGAATFSGLHIGDLVTISGLSNSANNGTFLVTGVSSDGSTLQVTNPISVLEASDTYSGSTFSATTGVTEGDTVIIGAPFSAPNQGTYRVIRRFNDSFWIENIDAIQEEVTLTSSSFTFYEYEATVPGDQIVISGTQLGVSNAGTYTITQVIDQNNVVVNNVLGAITNVSLNGLLSSFYVQEGIPYYGYKHVYLAAFQPGSQNNNYIVFDTNNQFEKINQTGLVEVTALNKLGFNTIIKQGLDSYKYNTGLIREANRIVYGDPRDPITYPGVGAAGADIFIREPLALRVQMSLDVRLQTGVPFGIIVDQVRSNVSSLINSNPVGQSIAISAIISTITTIPGIISVAVSFPNFSPTNDLIALTPSQKAFILDPSTDISVSQIL
jgi:hypothetical protein